MHFKLQFSSIFIILLMSLNPSTANVFYLTLRQSDWVSLNSSAQQPVFVETLLLVFNRVFCLIHIFLLVYPIYILENWELFLAINLYRLFLTNTTKPLLQCKWAKKVNFNNLFQVGAIAKDIQAAQKLVNNLESKLEMRKGERHSILMHCKASQRLY